MRFLSHSVAPSLATIPLWVVSAKMEILHRIHLRRLRCRHSSHLLSICFIFICSQSEFIRRNMSGLVRHCICKESIHRIWVATVRWWSVRQPLTLTMALGSVRWRPAISQRRMHWPVNRSNWLSEVSCCEWKCACILGIYCIVSSCMCEWGAIVIRDELEIDVILPNRIRITFCV